MQMIKNKSLIIIEGAQSTGKSTIINQIARQFPNFRLINEVARNLIKQLKISNEELQNNINNCFEKLQYQIMEAQSQKQIQYQNRYKKILVLDRCAISPLVYSLFYFKDNKTLHRKIQESNQFQNRVKIYKNEAVVFLLNPDQRIVKIDGVRKQSTFQELKQMTEIYRQIFKKYQIKYVEINQLENRLLLIEDVLMQEIHLTDCQWQQLKQPKERVKLIPDQINAKQNLIDSSRRHEENKQILFKREINPKQYKKQDNQIKISLDMFNRKYERNKNANFIIIKHLSINDKQIVLSFMKKPKNRLMAIIPAENLKRFLFVKIDSLYLDKKYVKKFLSSVIQINGEKYNFLGFSKSNLKDYGCYFYRQSSQEIIKLLNSFGNFDQIFSVSKKVSKLSLLYSSSNIIFSLQNHQIKIIKDIQKNDLCFSDGSGFVSRPLARKIKKQIGHLQYLPTAFQIRIKGIKGIVLLNPQYQDQQSIMARQSMVKFNANPHKLNELIIIDYSKPSRFAAINQQIIMLLSGLGISSQYLLQLQRNYLQKLKEAMVDPQKAIQLLTFLGRQDICRQIIQMQDKQEKLFIVKSLISEEIYRNIRSKDLKSKLKIPLENARLLFGAVYPELQSQDKKKLALKENQIFLRVTTNKGIVQTIIGTVIVAKNPCYYVGDVRVLQAVDISKQFPFANKLVDVIIFSTEGDLPVCTKISGSDYDGDHYFICWDQKLIPKKMIKPYEYPKILPKSNGTKVTQMDLINYFVYFDRTIVGRINNRYIDFASISEKGVLCKQCVQLGTQLFCRAIDSVSTGQKVTLPDHLRYVNPQQYLQEHIWIKMSNVYENFFEEHFNFDDALISSWDFTHQMMLNVVQTYVSSRNYNDYQLFKIIKSWMLSKGLKKYDLFKYVNFSQLSKQQKRQARQMQDFPVEYFGNPFDSSTIFSKSIFSNNGINFHTYQQAPKKWRRFYKSQNDINFQYLQQALDKFRDVLIGIKVNNQVDLVFCITNMKKLSYIENEIGQECIKAIYATKNQLKRIMNLGESYKLYYSNQLFQIYQQKRSNSFFWFKQNQVSIDLTRFNRNMLARHPRINKESIIQLQIFVGLSEDFKIPQILTLNVGNNGKNIKEESLEKPIATLQLSWKDQKTPEKKKKKYVEKKQSFQSKKYAQKKEEAVKKKKYVEKQE